MSLSFREVDFRTDLPKVPDSLPAIRTVAQTPEERARAVRGLAEALRIDEPLEVETPFGYALAGKGAQAEFFSASGAVRGRDLTLVRQFDDERRDWPDVEAFETAEGVDYRLGERSARELVDRSREILKGLDLLDDAAGVDVVLGRWAALDERGSETESGPGRATVRMTYSVEDLPLLGAGAKTNLHFDPVDGAPALARVFHVRRATEDVRAVETGGTERAFEALLADPFLVEKARLGGRVAVTSVRLGLLAMPADVVQRFAIPVLQVEGVVESLKGERCGDYQLRFGRYAPAVSAEALRGAGIAVPGASRRVA